MRPIDLYRFTQGADVFTYTSTDHTVTYLAEDYVPTAIGRGNIDLKTDLAKSNIEVRMPLTHPQAEIWLKTQVEVSIGLTVFQQNDLGTNVIWKGRMAGIKPGRADVAFTFESVFTSLRRPGLRARFQRTCRHPLYFGKCKLNRADFVEPGLATSASADGLVITVDVVMAAGDFFTGIIETPDDGAMRFITAQSGFTLTVTRPMPLLTLAALAITDVDVNLYPGCDRSRERCDTRFANLNNNGSFPYIPIKNPFDGTSIT